MDDVRVEERGGVTVVSERIEVPRQRVQRAIVLLVIVPILFAPMLWSVSTLGGVFAQRGGTMAAVITAVNCAVPALLALLAVLVWLAPLLLSAAFGRRELRVGEDELDVALLPVPPWWSSHLRGTLRADEVGEMWLEERYAAAPDLITCRFALVARTGGEGPETRILDWDRLPGAQYGMEAIRKRWARPQWSVETRPPAPPSEAPVLPPGATRDITGHTWTIRFRERFPLRPLLLPTSTSLLVVVATVAVQVVFGAVMWWLAATDVVIVVLTAWSLVNAWRASRSRTLTLRPSGLRLDAGDGDPKEWSWDRVRRVACAESTWQTRGNPQAAVVLLDGDAKLHLLCRMQPTAEAAWIPEQVRAYREATEASGTGGGSVPP